MAQQYIFQMQGLTKTFPGGRKIFENIWLSFYNDAKIGVVGVNGSGKSTLLKIMAGIDPEFSGEAKAADGIKRGYLEQEPHLDDALNVRENVDEKAAGAFGGWSDLNLMRNTYTHAEDTETKINEALIRGLLKAEIKTKLKLRKEP